MPLTPEQIVLYQNLLQDYRYGKTIPELAMRFGGDIPLAERTLRKAVKALLKDQAEEVRTQELDRLATLEATLWPQAIEGAAHAKNIAFDRLLRVIAMRLEWAGCRPAPPAPVQISDNRMQIVVQTFTQIAPAQAQLPDRGSSVEEQRREREGGGSPPSDPLN